MHSSSHYFTSERSLGLLVGGGESVRKPRSPPPPPPPPPPPHMPAVGGGGVGESFKASSFFFWKSSPVSSFSPPPPPVSFFVLVGNRGFYTYARRVYSSLRPSRVQLTGEYTIYTGLETILLESIPQYMHFPKVFSRRGASSEWLQTGMTLLFSPKRWKKGIS